MVNRKGFGYIVEAFVSSLVVLIFVLGSYHTVSLNEQSPETERKITVQDVTLTLQQSNNLEKAIQNGDPEIATEMISGLVSEGNRFQASISGPPTGYYSIGIYTPPNRLLNSSVESLTADDRCSGQLNETESEFTPVHTNSSSSIEATHGIRIYFTDRDTLTAQTSGYNSIRDYDSFYIDKGGDCQFTAEEGPFQIGERVKLENNTEKSYQIEKVENEIYYYYETPLASQISDHMTNYTPVRTEIKNVNFSDKFGAHDLMIFSENKTLDQISSNKDKFDDFTEEKPILLAMDLNRTVIEEGALSNTQFSWVNLSTTNPPGGDEKIKFSSAENAQRIERYLREIGYDTGDIEMEPGGRISSTREGRIEQNPLVISSNFRYDTDEWDYQNTSMGTEECCLDDVDDLSDCEDAHRVGKFEFPAEQGKEELSVFNTRLDGEATSCNIYGVTVDKNNDGEIQSDETTFLNGETTEIDGRKYTVSIDSHNSVSFEYTGNNRVEYLSLRREFADSGVEKFARLPKITESSPDSHVGLLTASSLFLLEGEKTLGSKQLSEGVSTKTSVPTENGVHEISVRWVN